jgi:chemotaxis protein MotA
MKSTLWGFLLGMAIFTYAINETMDDAANLVNIASVLIVFGGTFSVGVMTFGIKRLFRLFMLSFTTLKSEKYNNEKVIVELIDISTRLQKSPGSIKEIIDEDHYPFISDGLYLLYNEFRTDQIKVIMQNSISERAAEYQKEVGTLSTLAKYPPAFGMIGTIIGLVAVLQTMNNLENLADLGPTMGIALVTTLYGLFIANYFINPLSDSLGEMSSNDLKMRRIVYDAILMINRKEDPVMIREMLLGFLQPKQRVKFQKKFAATPNAKAA